MEDQTSEHPELEIEILSPIPSQIPQNPLPIEHIGLIFTVSECHHRSEVSESGEERLVWLRDGPRLPLCDHQFRSEIFNRGDDTLFCYLSSRFQSCELEGIDAEFAAKILADYVIRRWVLIREEANSRSSDRVYTMTVNLTAWYIDERRQIDGVFDDDEEEECEMTPACGGAVAEMLKRIEMEEDGDGICVICLDELKKKDEEFGLQMPCLHVFHGDCIKEWLSKSHLCPICRFQMPIHSN